MRDSDVEASVVGCKSEVMGIVQRNQPFSLLLVQVSYIVLTSNLKFPASHL